MKAEEIYHKMKAIAEPHHAYDDQMVAIAKWIEAEFDYNPKKLRTEIKTLLSTGVVWDTYLESIGLPINMSFSFGSEFGDVIYRLQNPKDNVRWCVFSLDKTYYVIKQISPNNKWVELWTKQMNKDLDEAKKYCYDDALTHYSQINT